MDAGASKIIRLVGKYAISSHFCSVVSPTLLTFHVPALDPTKLKSRQFSRTTADKPTASTLWTETPAERQARLADEVMGKRKRSEIAAGGQQAEEETAEDRKRRKHDVEIKKHVEKHNVCVPYSLSVTKILMPPIYEIRPRPS
jgi:Protein of unknown function (DUF3752)